jgi:protein-L-isoaspartate(D-aspartate) O-methyltransferase
VAESQLKPESQIAPDRTPAPDGGAQPDIQSYLAAHVDRLREAGALRDPVVERAFRRVPRHLFVERFFVGDEGKGWTPVDHNPERPRPEHLETIYSGSALITRLEDNLGTSSSSQPGLMADMLQLLELRPGMRVLEIGAGTGYNAALMAELVGDAALVTAVDIQADVVEQARRSLVRAGYAGARVLCRDGFEGAPEAAPFDRIVATVGCPDLSPRWVEQLAPDGFMLIPLRHAGANPLVRVWREEAVDGRGAAVAGAVVGFSGFMAIQGALRDERYYDFSPPPPGAAQVERPVWPELAAAAGAERTSEADWPRQKRAPDLPEAPRLAFWFYLGLRDPRTRLFRWLSSFGLEDKPSGRAARVEGDRLVGDPALLDELDSFYREWRALGAPGMRRYRLRFVPAAGGVDSAPPLQPAERTWMLAGQYYRRIFTLRPDRPERAA